MRAERSLSEVKTTARPSFSNSLGSAAERLKIAPFGANEPNSATSPPCACSGSASERITSRSTGSAGAEQILHVIGHGRLQIDQHRGGIADLVEPLQIDVDAGAPGDRGQVQHGV